MKKILIFALLASLFGNLSFAQSLQDWENASKPERGCSTIPYRDDRKDCEDNRPANKDYCKNSEYPVPRDPRNLSKGIEDIKQGISSQKGKLEAKEREKSQASDDNTKNKLDEEIRQIAEKIRENESKIEDNKRKLTEERNAVRGALSDAERCKEVRETVIKIFNRVIIQARNEGDPKIKVFADPMIVKWQNEQDGHKQAVTDIDKRISKLKDYLID